MVEINETLKIIEYDRYWQLPLEGKKVTRCIVDNRFALEFAWQKHAMTIFIGGDFTLMVGDKRATLSIEQPTLLGDALTLFNKTAIAAKIYKGGDLQLRFTDEIQLDVSAHSRYEAWEILGDNSLRVVCLPGGDLDIWQPI